MDIPLGIYILAFVGLAGFFSVCIMLYAAVQFRRGKVKFTPKEPTR